MTEEITLDVVEGDGKKEQSSAHVDLLKCCAVCKQSFAETQAIPKLLPCLHSVCEVCLTPSDAEVVETNSNGTVAGNAALIFVAYPLLFRLNLYLLLYFTNKSEKHIRFETLFFFIFN